MLVEVQDDFDLGKIISSGQCFRAREVDGGTYRFITGDKVIYISNEGGCNFSVSCGQKEWEGTWSGYFDLGRSYGGIRERERGKHPFIDDAMECGRGLRILRQDPWETLVTFIISQRKNIPAISKSVELLAARYGHRVETPRETLYSFPTPREMARATEGELSECSLGYRTQYVLDAVRQVLSGDIDLESLRECGDDQLLEALQKVRGVGKKVASCVALFAYGRTACVPVDVWISRAIRDDCGGESPFGLFGQNAGIIQQYVYYYEKHR